ncbi:(2Fe-2S)-binding protein [Streptomyces changanensis]|uniref:(2Fe-2S)-binding protein n=1 Tax=Streptomyces changanensis TaxID=2964669 RepID=A0ABY5NDL9_9ACTN|nr:(2Fe-2S)-binding protein [Streptomyces changanensis]UUS34127.1 (2Fe-2S)-binding protein [Streptomyces changanensis]
MAAEARRLTAVELRTLSDVGGFFVLPTAPPAPGTYVPLADAYAAPAAPVATAATRRDPAAPALPPAVPATAPVPAAPAAGPKGGGGVPPLVARVARVAERLGAPEYRVAASIAQLGLAARLWSVTLGSAALYGVVPDVTPASLHWDPARSTPEDLWWAGTATRPGTPAALREVVQDGHLVPLGEALRAAGPVSARLLWGNAGSALGGAVRELTGWARRHGRPEVAGRAAELAAGLLDHPDLGGVLDGPALRRRTCCLYYRCPGGGLCGDCVFDRPPRRTAAGGPGLAAGRSAP